MFDVGVPELVMVLVVALVVFGPGKLPEVGAALGKSIREFRRATQALTDEVHSVTRFDPLAEPAQAARVEAVQPAAAQTPSAAPVVEQPQTV